ncbi:MAG: hypothetical protein Q9169_007003 [Polycauliona sp. 2 TL-2023]
MDYMLAQTHRGDDESDPRAAMSKMGMNQSTQDRILDPEFEQLREPESIAFWPREERVSSRAKTGTNRHNDHYTNTLELAGCHNLPKLRIGTIATRPVDNSDYHILHKSIIAVEMRDDWQIRDGSFHLSGLFPISENAVSWTAAAYDATELSNPNQPNNIASTPQVEAQNKYDGEHSRGFVTTAVIDRAGVDT